MKKTLKTPMQNKIEKLTQKRINRLDEIGKECGYELHMPPLKDKRMPFFVVNAFAASNNRKLDKLIKFLSILRRSRFDIEYDVFKCQLCIIING